MEDFFERCVRLMQKTGDRVIVYNQQTRKAFALLSLEQYERLLEGRTMNDTFGPELLPVEDETTEIVTLEAEKGEGPIEAGQRYYFESLEPEQEVETGEPDGPSLSEREEKAEK